MNIPTHPYLLPADDAQAGATPVTLLTERDYATWLGLQTSYTTTWLASQGFRPERGRFLTVPGIDSPAGSVVVGLGSNPGIDLWLAAGLADRLPPGDYRLATPLAPGQATHFTLGWLQGSYRYCRYRSGENLPARPRLQIPPGADVPYAIAAAQAASLARDLINTPANDLGPAELEAAARSLASELGGELQVVQGEPLLAGYPLIEAVGRGSPRAGRLLDLRVPQPGAPRVTIVGKGVCFDTGGLDLKPAAGMLLMKKDMGGAACALALVQMLRTLQAPIDLRLLIPAVENSVDGFSFRPGDVLRSRKGLSVEIGNTDAEGRLVLADALADAALDTPDLLIDLATLTGAARVALGPELPAVFCGDPSVLADLQRHGQEQGDPLWPLPLWGGYNDELNSRIADLNNASASGFAGAITGALFLQRFVADPARWIHMDLYAWNPKDRPGRPLGAEAQGIRALYGLIRQRYG